MQLQPRKYWAKFRVIVMTNCVLVSLQAQLRHHFAPFRQTMRRVEWPEAGSCLFLAGNIGLHALGLGFTGIRLRFDSHWDNRVLSNIWLRNGNRTPSPTFRTFYRPMSWLLRASRAHLN